MPRVTPRAPPSNTDSPSLCAHPPRQCRGEASFGLDRLVSSRFRGGRFLPGCHGPTSAILTVETKTRISCALGISIGRALGHDATPLARTRGRPWFHATMNASVDRCWSVDPRGAGEPANREAWAFSSHGDSAIEPLMSLSSTSCGPRGCGLRQTHAAPRSIRWRLCSSKPRKRT